MPEEQQIQPTQPETENKGKTQAAPPAEAQKPDNQPQEQTVPYSRFKEVNERLKALEDEAAKQAAAQAKAEEDRMAEQQEWRELAEARGQQLEGAKSKAANYDKLAEVLSKQLKTEIDAWPEKVKALFPEDEMSVVEMMTWAERFRPLAQELAAEKAPPGNGRRPRAMAASGNRREDQIEPVYDVRKNF